MGAPSTTTPRSSAIPSGLVVASALVLIGCGSESTSNTLEFRGEAMGTVWRVIVSGGLSSVDTARLEQEIVATLELVEQPMSHWRDSSLVSRFNRSGSTRPLKVPSEMAVVINEALRTYELTEGAFDVTAAPLVDLWGFGPAGRRSALDPAGLQPDAEQIDAALRLVGSDKLHLTEAADGAWTLHKDVPGLQIDLSALAKGYAIDLVAEHLDSREFNNYLIEVGGEVRASGMNDHGIPWQIGLEQPDPGSIGRVRGAIALRDRAIATSGSYRNFIQAQRSDEPYSHLIDPRTGRPVTHDLVSVSVIASTAMRADAWATALMVMGPDAGFDLATQQKIAATFVVNSPTGVVERSTELFDQWTDG